MDADVFKMHNSGNHTIVLPRQMSVIIVEVRDFARGLGSSKYMGCASC